jgi:hypothetical protein
MTPKDFTILARKVAALLGDGFVLREDADELTRDVRRHLDTGEGWGVLLSTTWHNERLTIDGYLPHETQRFARYERKAKQITVALTRTPEEIAREIERRLLPFIKEDADNARGTYEEHVRIVEAVNVQVAKFEAVGFRRLRMDEDQGERATLRGEDTSHEVVLYHDRTSCLELCDLSTEQALEVLRLVQAQKERSAAQ